MRPQRPASQMGGTRLLGRAADVLVRRTDPSCLLLCWWSILSVLSQCEMALFSQFDCFCGEMCYHFWKKNYKCFFKNIFNYKCSSPSNLIWPLEYVSAVSGSLAPEYLPQQSVNGKLPLVCRTRTALAWFLTPPLFSPPGMESSTQYLFSYP